MRAPVNRRDPSGTRKIEREEIARQRDIIRRYNEVMADVATGDRPDKAEVLERLSASLKDDLEASASDWMRNAAETTVRVSDRVLNNLHTGIVLGPSVQVPAEEVQMLKANIISNVRSIGDDMLRDVTRITTEGYQAGLGADAIVREINKATDKQVSRAETIVRTETMRVCDVVAKERYKQAGCDGYMSYPTDDDRTCPKCIEKATGGNGVTLKVYGLNEPMALPWHPNCRCCRIPHFSDQEAIKI